MSTNRTINAHTVGGRDAAYAKHGVTEHELSVRRYPDNTDDFDPDGYDTLCFAYVATLDDALDLADHVAEESLPGGMVVADVRRGTWTAHVLDDGHGAYGTGTFDEDDTFGMYGEWDNGWNWES